MGIHLPYKVWIIIENLGVFLVLLEFYTLNISAYTLSEAIDLLSRRCKRSTGWM